VISKRLNILEFSKENEDDDEIRKKCELEVIMDFCCSSVASKPCFHVPNIYVNHGICRKKILKFSFKTSFYIAENTLMIELIDQ